MVSDKNVQDYIDYRGYIHTNMQENEHSLKLNVKDFPVQYAN